MVNNFMKFSEMKIAEIKKSFMPPKEDTPESEEKFALNAKVSWKAEADGKALGKIKE